MVILGWNTFLVICWHWHIQHLQVENAHLLNKRLEVLEFDWAHKDANSVLVGFEIVLSVLIVDACIQNSVQGNHCELVHSRWVHRGVSQNLANDLQVLI